MRIVGRLVNGEVAPLKDFEFFQRFDRDSCLERFGIEAVANAELNVDLIQTRTARRSAMKRWCRRHGFVYETPAA